MYDIIIRSLKSEALEAQNRKGFGFLFANIVKILEPLGEENLVATVSIQHILCLRYPAKRERRIASSRLWAQRRGMHLFGARTARCNARITYVLDPRFCNLAYARTKS